MREVTEVVVERLPKCDFCKEDARYDSMCVFIIGNNIASLTL